MKSLQLVRILYFVASAYEALLGLAFIVAGPAIFAVAAITPPNHWGYVHFAAGTLVIFGLMFLTIARRPIENRNLIPYGVLLKVCYVATIGWHWYNGGLPDLWKYFALADAIFAVLFALSLVPLEAAAADDATLLRADAPGGA
jgi:hypothetical protein